MSFLDLVTIEKALEACPPCPACKEVLAGARKAGFRDFKFIPSDHGRSNATSGLRVNAAMVIFGNGDLSRNFSIHHLQNQKRSWATTSGVWTSTKLVLETLLSTTGTIFYLDIPGYRRTLLIIPSSDLIEAYHLGDDRTAVTMSIPSPLKDTGTLPFTKYDEAWGVVPRIN